jgi:predicted phosphodiesterase
MKYDMKHQQIAVLSDIHGNLPALEAVLADMEKRRIKNALNLGDALYGPIEPVRTATLLMKSGILSVRGNEDRILIIPPDDASHSPSLEFTKKGLSTDHILWLMSLPITAVGFKDCFMFHGTPEQDDKYFMTKVTPKGVIQYSADELSGVLANIKQPVVLCGHDHTPCIYHHPSGKLIVNPGSVGLQAYHDDFPYPHDIETGSPHSRYAVLENNDGVWQAEIIKVEYDWNRAGELASAHGRPDWVVWLKTGKAGHE